MQRVLAQRQPTWHSQPITLLTTLLVGAVLTLVLTGCRPPWAKRDPSVTLRVQADTRMNVVNDRPNAAAVRIYQLRSRTNFDRASRATLWRDDTGALGTELVSKHEVTLLPEGQESVTLRLDKATRFVAVAADFYNPDGESWRVVYPAKPAKKPLSVRVSERQLSSR